MDPTVLGSRYLKVDHAGEHGAVQIYTGQIAVARWRCPELVPLLEEFRTHELRHRDVLGAALASRNVRRCRSWLLCELGGYMLGVLTALCGRKAIGATTAAVERVVLGHLRTQLAELERTDPAAFAAIASIVADEQTHHDSGELLAGSRSLWLPILTPIVAAATEAVIWVGMTVPSRDA